MAASATQATGSGAVRFVVCIEGLYQRFVSDSADVAIANDGVTPAYLPGLISHNWAFSEDVDLVQAAVNVQSVTVQIADVNNYATGVFDASPTWTSYLAADFTDVAASFTVIGGISRNVNLPGVVHVGLEAIYVSETNDTTF